LAAPLGRAAPLVSNFGNALAGLAAGLVVVGVVTLVKCLRPTPAGGRR
jgi:predicted DNA repair protein MutK